MEISARQKFYLGIGLGVIAAVLALAIVLKSSNPNRKPITVGRSTASAHGEECIRGCTISHGKCLDKIRDRQTGGDPDEDACDMTYYECVAACVDAPLPEKTDLSADLSAEPLPLEE